MSEAVYQGMAGVQVDTFAGPARDNKPRKRVQVSVLHPDTDESQMIVLDLVQWLDLCAATRFVGAVLADAPVVQSVESAGDHPAAPA